MSKSAFGLSDLSIFPLHNCGHINHYTRQSFRFWWICWTEWHFPLLNKPIQFDSAEDGLEVIVYGAPLGAMSLFFQIPLFDGGPLVPKLVLLIGGDSDLEDDAFYVCSSWELRVSCVVELRGIHYSLSC